MFVVLFQPLKWRKHAKCREKIKQKRKNKHNQTEYEEYEDSVVDKIHKT